MLSDRIGKRKTHDFTCWVTLPWSESQGCWSQRVDWGEESGTGLACSQTLYLLFKVRCNLVPRVGERTWEQGWVRRARVIKYKPQGIYWPPAKVVFSRACFARELADVFQEKEKKNKATSVYRLGLEWTEKGSGSVREAGNSRPRREMNTTPTTTLDNTNMKF